MLSVCVYSAGWLHKKKLLNVTQLTSNNTVKWLGEEKSVQVQQHFLTGFCLCCSTHWCCRDSGIADRKEKSSSCIVYRRAVHTSQNSENMLIIFIMLYLSLALISIFADRNKKGISAPLWLHTGFLKLLHILLWSFI